MANILLKLKREGHLCIDLEDILYIHDTSIGTQLKVKNSTATFDLEKTTLELWQDLE